MLGLTRQEKIILIFLTLSFVVGLGINIYKKSHQGLKLDVQPYINVLRENSDRFIKQQRYVNINSFDVDRLIRLPGVGRKLAERIVQYRKAHGPFKNKEELMKIKGIGEKKFNNIKDLIILE